MLLLTRRHLSMHVTLASLDAIERATITGYRWWSRQELAATAEAYFPAELPELLRLADDAGPDSLA
jgi:hypothetical protein